ncbi:glycosyltransferase involved in cell wall biosynthesis [Arthrobacter ginsengisoli]|uniref:Glycosyltransferase involved in cell wall biosynthesis n=2 Tax=Arthrobacter ginsengisoli TaxID=1356565 RepID=A0ABU1UDD0_9MICC|nr:glycosyltransferase family 4 protein [Arthrobacter ginsengisoli]MDR7083176.1 glycosyltransferase involved in cell wall biosynthesis [Arthrobacter ginsengisoli]
MGNLFFARRSDALQVYVFHASPALELRTKAVQSDSFNLPVRFRVWVLRELERRCLSKADSVVVLSEFSKRILLQEYSWLEESDITVLPGGSDVAGIDAKTRRPGTSKRLIALRRLEWRTGVDLLLQAFSDSGIAEQGWELDVIGSGSLADELQERSKSLGIDAAVTFHGLVSEEGKSDLLSKAQLFVLPTRAFEGFGLATVEAMAHGLVPIVTSAGASPEIVGDIDPELVCEPTVSSLTTALQLWTSIEYQDKIAEVSTRSSKVAAAYDWSSVGARYLELVDTLAAKKMG